MKKRAKKRGNIRGRKSKRGKKRNFLRYISTAIIVLAIIVIGLYLFDTNNLPRLGPEKVIQIQDKCGILFQTIIHHIKSESNCASLCKIECDSQDLTYSRVEFVLNQTACHSCTCYCR